MKQLIILLFSFLFFSCNKSTSFKFTITEPVTSIPVENAIVLIYSEYFTGGIGSTTERTLIDSIYTDSAGVVYYSTNDEINSLDVIIEKENYFTMEISDDPRYNFTTILEGEGIEKQFEMDPFAFFQVEIIDSPGIDSGILFLNPGWTGATLEFSSGDHILINHVRPYGNFSFTYYSQNENLSHNSQPYIEKGDTFLYTIEY